MANKEVFKQKAASGVLFLVVKRILIQVIFTTSNIFLARLLFPQDFGVWAIVISIGSLFTVFTDLGLGPALVQKKEKPDEADIKTAFSAQILLGLLVITIILLISDKIAVFFNSTETSVTILRIYSLIFLINPFRQIPQAMLERHLNYQKLVLIELTGALISSAATVLLAFFKFGVVSFALGLFTGYLASALLYFIFAPWPVGLTLRLKNFQRLGIFGIPFQANTIFGLFYGPLIILYLGKIVGRENLGFYQFAASLSVSPLAISEIINRVIFPLGARTGHDKLFLRKIIERSITIISQTTLPTTCLIMATVPQIIHFIYTDRWQPAAPAIYLGLLQMAIIAYTGAFSQILLAQGQSKTIRNLSFIWAVLTWVLAPPAIAIFNFVGLNLASLAVTVSGIWLFFRLKREINFVLWPNFYPYLSAALTASIIVKLANQILPLTFLNFALILGFGLSFYLILILIFRRKETLQNLQLLFSLLPLPQRANPFVKFKYRP